MFLFGPIIGLIFIIPGCLFLQSCFLFWRKQRQLHLQGITVQGQVIERYQERGPRGQPWHYLTCRYSYEGQTYISNQPVWKDLYKTGISLVSLRCLPNHPEVVSVLGDTFQSTEWIQRTILGIIFLLVGGSIVIGSFIGAFAS